MQNNNSNSQSCCNKKNNSSFKSKSSNTDCKLFTDGKTLNIIAASSANIIAGKFTNKEIEVLALFFATLSDSLSTIVATNLILEGENDSVVIDGII